jgi:hypothetical protein
VSCGATKKVKGIRSLLHSDLLSNAFKIVGRFTVPVLNDAEQWSSSHMTLLPDDNDQQETV